MTHFFWTICYCTLSIYRVTLGHLPCRTNPQHKHIEIQIQHLTVANETQYNTDLNIVNLSSYKLTRDETTVLKRGLRFCPNENLDKFELTKDLQIFAWKLILRSFYQKQRVHTDPSPNEAKALDQLISLLEESDQSDLIDRVDLNKLLAPTDKYTSSEKDASVGSQLIKKSDKFPAPSLNANVAAFLKLINKDLGSVWHDPHGTPT